MRKIQTSFIVTLIVSLLFPSASLNAVTFELVKSESFDTVYFIDAEGMRHPFPNRATYVSWYGEDFSMVTTVSDDTLASFPLGGNIVIRSGNLIKVPSAPEVYVTEPGGILRKLEHEDLAIHFFGSEWNKKVIDVPESFFTNYQIDDPIRSGSDVPDGIVYQLIGEPYYYYKNRDVLTRFASFEQVIENRFDTQTIIRDSKAYFTRNHVITGIEKELFNPVIESNSSTADCNAESLTAGVVFLHEGPVHEADLANLSKIKNEFPEYWFTQSREFSNISFPYPIQIIDANDDNRKPNEFGRYEVTHEVGFDYYDTLNDTVDFIIVFTDFSVGEKEEAFFSPITQSVEGIGKLRLDRSALFGSKGKLKGIVVMGDLDNFTFFEQRRTDSAFNIIAHELLHNWSGTLKYRDDNGDIQTSLLAEDGKHWSQWVTFLSPLGGQGWHEDATPDTLVINNLYTETLAIPFSDLDLYAMGLLPWQAVTPFGFVADNQLLTNTQQIIGEITPVSIEQIRAAHGKIRCITP